MSKRIALVAAILFLLIQAVPAIACVAMPAQVHSTCCCEPNGQCAMVSRPQRCAAPDACCVQATGSTPALSRVEADAAQSVLAVPSPDIVPPTFDSFALLARRPELVPTDLDHPRSAPLPAVPLYLRHLRLTL